jgi:hypothetical protein
MTSEQINEARNDATSEGDTDRARNKAERLYNEANLRTWHGTVRSKPPYTQRGEFHYHYQSALLLEVADGKGNKQARRYYNRQAAKLEAKADALGS